MLKPEFPCVQHLSLMFPGGFRSVDFVSQHRVTNVMQMHPNLMGASTVQFALHETHFATTSQHAIICFCFPAAF